MCKYLTVTNNTFMNNDNVDNDIFIAIRRISRRHCEIIYMYVAFVSRVRVYILYVRRKHEFSPFPRLQNFVAVYRNK